MTKNYSTYVLAGYYDEFKSLYNTVIKDNDEDSLERLFDENVNRFLKSFGVMHSKRKTINKSTSKKFADNIRDLQSNYKLVRNSELLIDSGGFQVGKGLIRKELIKDYTDDYCDFLIDNYDIYTMSFILDLPAFKGGIFNSYSEMEDLNRYTYNEFSNLSQQVKDKVFWIYHFNSPKLYDIWSRFLWDEDLANGFTNFAIGGDTASESGMILYSIPLSEIAYYCKQKNIPSFKFHILGGTTARDILLSKLFTKHIKTVHNLDIELTHDSSKLSRVLFSMCCMTQFINGKLDIDISYSKESIYRKKNGITVKDLIYSKINGMCDKYGLKTVDEIHCPIWNENGSMCESFKQYLVLQQMTVRKKIDELCTTFTNENYNLYLNGKIDEFVNNCLTFMSKMNKGKTTRKLQTFCYNIPRTLDVITKCDRDLNKYLIDRYMSKQDIPDMMNDSIMLV